jgi:type II secretion system protein L
MTLLRFLVAAAPSSERACDWALYDDSGACVRSGRDRPSGWPSARRIEAVIAASQVRIASVALPPLPPARVSSAAAFAIEDQLAGPTDAQHLAVSAQQSDGHVRVAIVARAFMTALTDRGARNGPLARLVRVIVEPDLAASPAGWRWCAGGSNPGEGFVRRADGSAFPVGAADAAGALPAEIAVALEQARRDGAPPQEVRVDAAVGASNLPRWQSETGVPFVRGTVWKWHEAPAAAFANAIDLLQGGFALLPAVSPGARGRLFTPALIVASAALALHIVATIGEWSWLKVDNWQRTREWKALATTAGIGTDAAATPSSVYTALARRLATLRHAQGLPAPDDALPLLALAAPALGALPPGTVRNASYADGHWTLDLSRADAAVVGDLDSRMKLAGIPVLVATSKTGVRVRIGAQ